MSTVGWISVLNEIFKNMAKPKTFTVTLTPGATIDLGKRKIEITKHLGQGDLCDLYLCKYSDLADHTHHGGTRFDRIVDDDDDGLGLPGILKIPTFSLDNDFVQNEAQVLSHLFPPSTPDEKFYRYLPRLAEVLEINGKPANLFRFYEGYVSLADIMTAYPKGIDFRDMVWMFKRILAGIGFAHTKLMIHAAIIPTHVLVHPLDHGAKIIDWSYSTTVDGRIKGYSAAYEAYYPPEVFKRERPTARTDIFMAAKCAWALIGGGVVRNELPSTPVPKEIVDFLRMCMEPSNLRPDNAWDLLESFDKLLEKVVGKPVYRPFKMP